MSNDKFLEKLDNKKNEVGAKKTLADLIEKMKPQLQMALPKHITADKMARLGLTEMRINPKLGVCTPESFLGALMIAGQLGLEIGAYRGHAYLVPYDKKQKVGNDWRVVETNAQFIMGYQGYKELMYRTGNVKNIQCNPVHEKDFFELIYGTEPRLTHIPYKDGDRGKVTHFYALALFKDGGFQADCMSAEDIEKIRLTYSQAKGKDSPWEKSEASYREMAKKTVFKRMAKYADSSTELRAAIALDDLAEAGLDQKTGDLFKAQLEQPESPILLDDRPVTSLDSAPIRNTNPLEMPKHTQNHQSSKAQVSEFMVKGQENPPTPQESSQAKAFVEEFYEAKP